MGWTRSPEARSTSGPGVDPAKAHPPSAALDPRTDSGSFLAMIRAHAAFVLCRKRLMAILGPGARAACVDT